jgi:8-oxo-dGTP pyrophosphatase MutT (NUDIX family)
LVYRAYKDSERLRQEIAEEEKCKPEEIRCEGCQTVLTDGWESKEWGKSCKIVACLEAKGLDFCFECDAYPKCERFHEIADHLLTRRESLMENLEKIKTGKVEKWLEDEDRKWRCAECTKPISAYRDHCHWCGAEVKIRIVPKTIRIQWDEGRFGVRTVGVMLDDKNRVLLYHLEGDDFWVFPGGGIAPFLETSKQAIERNFIEKAGFEIKVHRLLWVLELYFVDQGKRVHGIGFYFLVSPKETKGVWEQDEFAGHKDLHRNRARIFKWFDISKLNEANLYPSSFRELLKDIPEHPVHVVHNEEDNA